MNEAQREHRLERMIRKLSELKEAQFHRQEEEMGFQKSDKNSTTLHSPRNYEGRGKRVTRNVGMARRVNCDGGGSSSQNAGGTMHDGSSTASRTEGNRYYYYYYLHITYIMNYNADTIFC